MRRALVVAAVLAAASLCPPVAEAARRSKDRAGAADAKAAAVKVTAKVKAVLRAEPSEIGKPLGKVRPKEKLLFLGPSEDNIWVQVRKGKLAAWLKMEEVDGVPEPLAAAPDPAPVKAPDKGPAKSPDKAPDKGPKPIEPVAVAPTPLVTTPITPVPPAPIATPVIGEDVSTAASAPPSPRLPLSGLWFSVGGGVALLGSSLSSTFKSGLDAELFNYDVSSLPSIAAQARIGYTYGYRWLRVGVDAGYRFAGGTQIVVKLADRDAEPVAGSAAPEVLKGLRQDLSVNAHDADAALSVGGYVSLGQKLGLSLRARGGLQFHAFVPEFSSAAALPSEIFYGPLVGGIAELQTRSAPGFLLRIDGSYIPYGVRSENVGLRDAVLASQPSAECSTGTAAAERCSGSTSSSGFSVGASAAFRVTSVFNVELGYRILSTQTSYPADTVPERLQYNRDSQVRARAQNEQERLLTSSRSTSQQTIYLGVSFNL